MGQPGLFLRIFALFKHKFTEKIVGFSGIVNLDRWSKRRARWPLDHHHGPLFTDTTATLSLQKGELILAVVVVVKC